MSQPIAGAMTAIVLADCCAGSILVLAVVEFAIR
jgi:hypothetical protein